MKTQTLGKYLMVVATVCIMFTACKKENDAPADNDTSAASDNAIAESAFNDAKSISDQAADGTLTSYLSTNSDSEERGMMSACATITHDTISIPHTITVDFGSTNCMCGDGRNRRGIINISYTGRYRDSASTHSMTFTNYFVNDNQVSGTHTVTNNGHNNYGHLTFSIAVNGTITKANSGGTISWTSTRIREWIEGESTHAWADDVYLITGSANGSSSNGNSFTASITSPLKIKLNCQWIASGSLDLTPAGKPTRTINWGNGNCDNQATVTINGTTHNITLN